MDANSEGIIVVDAQDARILDVNPALIHLWSYRAKELVGMFQLNSCFKNQKGRNLHAL